MIGSIRVAVCSGAADHEAQWGAREPLINCSSISGETHEAR